MLYLSVGLNLLSGSIPKEIGNLNKLISFGFGPWNNFSGPLPPELGNLTSLEQMTMDNNGFSGELPSTLAKLQKLKNFWASGNNFGGKVPDFFGNLTNLENLRLEGNSFEGPIPSNFASLVKLFDLRLCDLSNESSSMAFIENMTSLSILILRDSKISDTIPLNFGIYKSLMYLDMSFNNLTGQFPVSLFNMDSLQTFDLSYNELSGILPSWTSEEKLRLNLVANNFDDSVNALGWGLSCLQRSMPCYRGSPTYYSFAINAGGSERVFSDGAYYEPDDNDMSFASYYVRDTMRWAISNVGTFVGSQNPTYTQSSLTSFINASQPKLFQSTRLSPSSLRYYGLLLENGKYTITLQFAEIGFSNDFTWKSFGKRIFDIYIQGILTVRDFDITKAAGGKSFQAVKLDLVASVTDNFLEVHLFWAGKGTCCIPTDGYYGPSISAISISPNFNPTVSNQPPKFHSPKNKTIAIAVGIFVGGMFLLSLFFMVIWMWRRRC